MIHKITRLENVNGKLSFRWEPGKETAPISPSKWDDIMKMVEKMGIGEEKIFET